MTDNPPDCRHYDSPYGTCRKQALPLDERVAEMLKTGSGRLPEFRNVTCGGRTCNCTFDKKR